MAAKLGALQGPPPPGSVEGEEGGAPPVRIPATPPPVSAFLVYCKANQQRVRKENPRMHSIQGQLSVGAVLSIGACAPFSR